MVKQIIVAIIAVLLVSCGSSPKKYELVWSDEFDYTGLPDELKWNYDTIGNSYGWGNNELQFYTVKRKENTWVENGMLTITALKEKGFPMAYTSARLTTKHKGDWLYGRIEVRAKLPSGTGIWPAIWMLPTENAYGGWPKSGEIDIMEHVGYNPDSVFFTVHTEAFNHIQGTEKSKPVFMPEAEDEFFTYGIEWNEKEISFLVDGKEVYKFKNRGTNSAEWPFNKAFHLLLNVAVGGNWGGVQGVNDDIFPQSMQIDYVRVYQKK
ncbi:glycoside hydrolase family 16 protein [Plebeiibacterium sediminum]|uniref:Glycoside hydrolase family 16 protein n=1 Tax=Plebeiibacterium sediminum TaxID=2992112 RepID=A0AAE3SF42_9BACT|nr:glycoside hydrolase family 16 protein [Plebeiobacterium sediminum]MCW3785778.1 glycoside hydrolase family 16 protein [Plebeiobacterium sediminum]